MTIILYTTNSEKNSLNKSLSSGNTFTGTLRTETSITIPEIMLESNSNLSGYNYAYIPEFGRYYFIRDIRSYRDKLWVISMRVDVLMSFKNAIKASKGILTDTQTTEKEYYLSDDSWVSTVKDKTDIIAFSSGFNESGEYILITAGG